ncbi:hypothetical protein ACFQXA_13465 [Nocardiopsis composta]
MLHRSADRARGARAQFGGELGGHPLDAQPPEVEQGVPGGLGGVHRRDAPLHRLGEVGGEPIGVGGRPLPAPGRFQRLDRGLARAGAGAQLVEPGGQLGAAAGEHGGPGGQLLPVPAGPGEPLVQPADLGAQRGEPLGVVQQVLQPGDLVPAAPLGGAQPVCVGGQPGG